jgi:Holliday junction DNA helicase RuvA
LTYDYVREDTHQLFGFMTEEERRLFLLLMTVSGIGPKLALTALSGLSVRELKAAISQGDAARLSSISGIGKKTADRIIVDLRNKVGKAEGLAAGEPAAGPDDMKMRDAVLALISLGYKRAEAQKMVQDVVSSEGTDKDVETIIRKALAK